ncbi:MAG: ribosomal RNA small subunit methyltransferase A [Bacteroidetes bacterium]|nr:ribosomal RNA small subunit methyltransferase A [Bacteroidota bacterium]
MKAKKSLGQNFLKSDKALSQMIDISDIHADDIVLEIGPGKGALTEKLLNLAPKVIAIEKDRELIPVLSEKFLDYIKDGRLDLIEGDILEFDEEKLKLYKKDYKLIANIPYYITGAIVRKFLESNFQPDSMTLLIQKEVAERIVAKDGKESILSLSVKAYGIPKFVSKVSKRYFSPEPKVDSAIIYISNINKDNFKKVEEKIFFEVIKMAFGQKRKTLLNNFDGDEKVREFLLKHDFDLKIRAEDLKIEDFLALAESFPQK